MPGETTVNLADLANQIKTWGRELGFQQVAIAGTNLENAGQRLQTWLQKNYQGDMDWMQQHGSKRWRPAELLAGTQRAICVRLDYLPPESGLIATLKDGNKAYLSRYALGRDYHKVIRNRLAELCKRIESACGQPIVQRPFVDSAPVMEKPLAEKAGLGWIGKHSLLLNRQAGSWFFLGEIYTNLPLPVDQATEIDRCGNCSACLKICPTNAFPKPYVLDARRCISYLTIEHQGAIPEPLRGLMGNRVFGCDDCQAVCPWNRYASPTDERDFKPRHGLANPELTTLFLWTEQEFNEKTTGSPIRRIGYERWLRNLAVGLGNAPSSAAITAALEQRREHPSALVREHVLWALAQQASPTRRPRAGKALPPQP